MTNPQDAAFYDDRWSRAELSAAKRVRARAIIDAVSRESSPLAVLELGCGTGWLCNELSTLATVTGVDISRAAVEAARERFPHVTFVCADVGTWTPDRVYDVVISHEVIEHLRDQERHIALARDALRPGGLLVITTPNAFAAYGAQAMIRNAYERQPVENWLYKAELVSLIKAHGFAIEQATTVVSNRGYRNRVLRFLASSRVERWAERVGARDAWDATKGRFGLNESLFVLARRR